MNTKIVEVVQGLGVPANWGKMMVCRFESKEWARESCVSEDVSLIRSQGWTPDHVMVLDLATGEGAMFMPGGSAAADLDKHKVWVCPLFEPFLTWLYEHVAAHPPNPAWSTDPWWQHLPEVVELPDAPFAMRGYRRQGLQVVT